jgi:hypothetical protein
MNEKEEKEEETRRKKIAYKFKPAMEFHCHNGKMLRRRMIIIIIFFVFFFFFCVKISVYVHCGSASLRGLCVWKMCVLFASISPSFIICVMCAVCALGLS